MWPLSSRVEFHHKNHSDKGISEFFDVLRVGETLVKDCYCSCVILLLDGADSLPIDELPMPMRV